MIKKKMEAFFTRYRLHASLENNKSLQFVKMVDDLVNNLPDLEKELINKRYLTREADYITDWHVYKFELCVSAPTFIKLREKAFSSLLEMMESEGINTDGAIDIND